MTISTRLGEKLLSVVISQKFHRRTYSAPVMQPKTVPRPERCRGQEKVRRKKSMEKEYIELFGKRYLKCTSCKYGENGHCSLFDCSYGNSDGCEEKTIENAEKTRENKA